MRLRILILSTLVAIALAPSLLAADSVSESQDKAYRDYLEAQQKSEAAYRRDNLIHTAVVLALVAGVVAFVIIPVRRRTEQAMAINEKQLKTLEEIRDLLKKQ